MPGGRPQLPPAYRRTASILVRVSPAEHAAITARARETGRPVSRYLREVGVGLRPRVPAGAANAAAVRELGRIGNNLNQLAREANAGRLADLEARVEAALAELHAVVGRL